MARKTVERNISYDDKRKLYYVSMDLGKDSAGKRVKQYQTFPTLSAARAGLRDFLSHREQEMQTPRHQVTLSEWLEDWMDTIVRPNRAETTVYAYQKIIDNHIGPFLGDKPLLKNGFNKKIIYDKPIRRVHNVQELHDGAGRPPAHSGVRQVR